MRFANSEYLAGVAFALLLAAVFIVQAVRLAKSRARFGDPELVLSLLTYKTGNRRALSAVVLCVAVALSFVAAARPQYGEGTRVLPATNLDVVLVLDYSKSMNARDVTPSRMERAKVEVVRMVRELSGARFGAVAFAGDNISFPLTSDGGAIAQFFRGLSPNDMAVGGTAIARALMSGKNLLERDPLSKGHERVIVLITDGEDLEGDPASVAQTIAQDGTRVEVVQIGGTSPEPVPEIDDTGKMVGLRRDESGKIMTTQLSPEGEAQLEAIASEGHGSLVRASSGQTGIDEMSARLRKLMTEELSERVETVYADVFEYPLGLAVFLLMLEVWIGTARVRRVVPEPPRQKVRRRRSRRLSQSAVLLSLLALGCDSMPGFVNDTFQRESPSVAEAISALHASEYERGTELLTEYLQTGPCEEGVLGTGDRARDYFDASFDLALAFSGLTKTTPQSPQPAGSNSPTAAVPPSPLGSVPPGPAGLQGLPGAPDAPDSNQELDPVLLSRVGCGLRLLAPISVDQSLPAELRARAYYLSGNLEMARTDYEAAIESYDAGLLLAPGVEQGQGDPIGIEIAYNRALAQRLLQQEKEKEEQEKQQNEDQDPSQEDSQEPPADDNQEPSEDEQDQEPQTDEQDQNDAEDDQSEDQGDEKEPESQPNPEESQDDQNQQQTDNSEQKDSPESDDEKNQQPGQEQAPSSSAARDERMLDLLEQAPTLQQHDAQQRKAAGAVGRPTMEDK